MLGLLGLVDDFSSIASIKQTVDNVDLTSILSRHN